MRLSVQRQNQVGIILLCISGFLLISLLVAYWTSAAHRQKLDKASGCPQSGPHSITAILLDLTDPVSPVQKEALIKYLDDLTSTIPQYGELALFTIKPTSNELLHPVLEVCNPGRGSDVNMLTGNPALVEKRWQKNFYNKFNDALSRLLTSEPDATSPILECIQQIAVQLYLGNKVQKIPKELIIISDMIQNTKGLSQYRRIESFQTFRTSSYYLKVRPQLSGVKVKIFYLRRTTASRIQGKRHIEFWNDYFTDAGGTLEEVISVEG